ncbi:MAG TPA: hypothetical protein VFJ15_06715 [Oleiagrimonas sp.]|nr:hypothetical protein [Oleiagrimonas sp.]
MSDQQIVRVTDEVRIVSGKKNPNARYGFQTCGLSAGGGMFKMFDRMFSPDRGETQMPAGDYLLTPKPGYIDGKGNLRIGYDLVPAKAATKAA